jgi:serine/threonine protein kinase
MRKLLRRLGKLQENDARLYIAEILLAIQYLHKREIIFRDLKPDNIVIDKDGHCKLTDFGLSKEGIDDNYSAKSFCGSLAYLAPEMLERKGHGKSVDWYLLGVLLYEMLVGKTPYYSTNKDMLLENIQNGDLYLPRDMSN